MKQNAITKICFDVGRIASYFFLPTMYQWLKSLYNRSYTGFLSRGFKHLGNSVFIWRVYTLRGKQYIEIGDNNIFERDLQLTATASGNHTPSIIIGNNCLFRRGFHLTAVNSITIGDNVLTGTNVLISDNGHGDSSYASLHTSPRVRPVASKGSVVIGNNVWLGNNVCVMPGVTIGNGVVVGANSVVTHDIPSFCVAAGAPARILVRCSDGQLP